MTTAAARSPGPAPVIIALAGAVAFGAIDQYLPVAALKSSHPGAYQFVVQVSGMSAPWLAVPFLAGAWQASQLRAALTGLAASWLAVLAYVVMIVSPVEGVHLTAGVLAASLASQWPWFAGGLITGPLYGWLGHRWRARGSVVAALLAAMPVLLEPAARWLATRTGTSGASWLSFQWPLDGSGVAAEFAEVAVGLLLTAAVLATTFRSPRPGATASPRGRPAH